MKNKRKAMGLMSRLNRKMFSDREDFGQKTIGRGQMKLLDHIINNEGLSQDQLAKELGIDKTTVAKSVKKLEQHNLIERRSNEVDKRKKTMFATNEAKAIQEQMLSRREKHTSTVFEGVSDDELEMFSNVLLKIENNLDAYYQQIKERREFGRMIVKILYDDPMSYDKLFAKLEMDEKVFKEKIDRMLSKEILIIVDSSLVVNPEWIERKKRQRKNS